MPFRSGSVSYARFAVRGGPSAVSTEVLDTLAANILTPPEIGAPPEIQAGWTAGRHVFDTSFDPDAVVFGETLLLGVRVDTNRVPAELRRAYRALAEQARAADSVTGMISGREKRESREEADERCRTELATGRFRRSKMMPILWRVDEGIMLAPIFSDAAREIVRNLMLESFDAVPELHGSGALAESIVSAKAGHRAYEDLSASALTAPPASTDALEGSRHGAPPVPWAIGTGEHKDFLGNEFLLWLWHRCETSDGAIDTVNGSVAIALDRVLEMECAWDVTGNQNLRADAPTRLPEARTALAAGKWPRKVGLLLAARGEQVTCTIQGDRFLVGGAKLARPEEPPASERESIEQRLSAIEVLDRAIVDVYRVFLEERTSSGWNARRDHLRSWISRRGSSRATERPVATAEIEVDVAAVEAAVEQGAVASEV